MNKKTEPTAKKTPEYFAALNTGDGFISHFDVIFRRCDHIYIIKGGPGCGKSTLMRRIADEAAGRGYPVELFYCSSDPSSLDGIIVGNCRFAVVDGTSPHILEPRNLGAVDSVVDLGGFLNDGVLRKDAEIIKNLSDDISGLYASTYNYMKLMTVSDKIAFEAVGKYICRDKMVGAIRRLVKKIDREDDRTVRVRNISAFGCRGQITLDSFEKRAEERFALRDRFGIAPIFLGMLSDELEAERIGFDISFSPVSGSVGAVLVRGEGLTFVTHPVGDGLRTLNTERFLDKRVSEVRKTVENMRSVRAVAAGYAEKTLSRVGELHGQLEKIYARAMDFEQLDCFTEHFVKKMFGA